MIQEAKYLYLDLQWREPDECLPDWDDLIAYFPQELQDRQYDTIGFSTTIIQRGGVIRRVVQTETVDLDGPDVIFYSPLVPLIDITLGEYLEQMANRVTQAWGIHIPVTAELKDGVIIVKAWGGLSKEYPNLSASYEKH